MSNVVIITAKGNNKSIHGKNTIKIVNTPCIVYGIRAGLNAKNIERTFVFSDSQAIRKLGERYNCISIKEPKKLTAECANHGDAIAYAVNQVKEKYLPDLEIVTVLLGNSVAVNSELIDLSIEILKKNKKIDSVMSVWRAQDDHPYRALKINKKGFLESFLRKRVGTSRQSYPPVYYYDQGIWTFRWENILKKNGPSPWWWMGKNSFPIIRNWVTGRDIHTQLDIDFCEYWIKNKHKDEIMNIKEINRILHKD